MIESTAPKEAKSGVLLKSDRFKGANPCWSTWLQASSAVLQLFHVSKQGKFKLVPLQRADDEEGSYPFP